MSKYVLEPEAQEIADATANPPYLYEIGVDAARKVLDDIQAAPVEKIELGEDKWITVPAEVGDVKVRIIKPRGGDCQRNGGSGTGLTERKDYEPDHRDDRSCDGRDHR